MYAIVDIETTGGYASANGITEISVFIHDGEKVVKHFETLINPQQIIPRYITALTGIDNSMTDDAPTFEEIAPTLYELLQDKIFVAHNVNFDYSFIRHQLKVCGYDLMIRKLCTVRLGRKVFPGLPSYSLGNLCRSLNIVIENRHRAGGDAKATVQLFDHLLANGAIAHIEQMLKKISSEQWLPLHLDKNQILQLPATPGVYYFLDNKNKVVYVGKAINLRKRVSSHFTVNDAGRKRQNFLRNVHKISHKECASELEAIVLESVEIKRLWPKYNKSQKQPVQKFGLYLFEDNKGYLRLAIDKKKKHLQALYSFNLLHEGLVMLIKMIEEFKLDRKLCFVDKNPFTEEELKLLDAPVLYNKKIKKAITALNEQLPTFAVVDDGINEDEKLCLLIERGSFWGMGHLPAASKIEKSDELKALLNPYSDNDYICNSIYSFVELNPDKKIVLQ
ncbi:exonuclease domain-containing protein [Ferruginibacter albus]|uniref:exonuclease domain-containing protein n=1 Tax=Ferruginibacter albus TaxID=2875540 RepID=UPI001CC59BB1|nr:exonuclease domain-containing protein [Ferruginibacter albus]UAY52932.1 GIY-YIG nuclease family protein [Ferruginibacter albus]